METRCEHHFHSYVDDADALNMDIAGDDYGSTELPSAASYWLKQDVLKESTRKLVIKCLEDDCREAM